MGGWEREGGIQLTALSNSVVYVTPSPNRSQNPPLLCLLAAYLNPPLLADTPPQPQLQSHLRLWESSLVTLGLTGKQA